MIIKIVIYIAMQVSATLLFKWGSDTKEHWMLGFLLGNALAASSIWFLMGLYKQMNPNIAMGICAGLATVLGQITMTWVFNVNINYFQWLGIELITCGLMLLCIFNTTLQTST